MLLRENAGTQFEQPPIGTHVARCVKLIDIGTQDGEYQGKPTRKRQMIVGWELGNELMSDGEYAGKPFTVTKFYTMSLGEKANLRKDLANWRGRDFTAEELAGFDAKKLLGLSCMVSLTENAETGRVRVTGVTGLPRGMTQPEQVNPTFYLSLEAEEFDPATFEKLSDKMKEMIRKAPEYHALRGGGGQPQQQAPAPDRTTQVAAVADMDDDIPF